MDAQRRPAKGADAVRPDRVNCQKDSAATLIDELMERATVASYDKRGPVGAALIEEVAHALRLEAVDLLGRGYQLQASAALALADRLDETAELGRILRSQAVT